MTRAQQEKSVFQTAAHAVAAPAPSLAEVVAPVLPSQLAPTLPAGEAATQEMMPGPVQSVTAAPPPLAPSGVLPPSAMPPPTAAAAASVTHAEKTAACAAAVSPHRHTAEKHPMLEPTSFAARPPLSQGAQGHCLHCHSPRLHASIH